jgi:hypothetical protein
MSKINNFLKNSQHKDLDQWEKLYGQYGCKYCKESSEFAYWDKNNSKLIWVCSKNHRTEMQFD